MRNWTLSRPVAWSIKLIIFTLLCWTVYQQIQPQLALTDWESEWQRFYKRKTLGLLLLAFFLMPINYSVEAIKWQHLIKSQEAFSFLKAMKAVFCGICLSLVTPNRVGEFGGKVLLAEKTDKRTAAGLALLGSFSQLLASGILGGISLLAYSVLVESHYGRPAFQIIACAGLMVLFVLLLVYFRLKVFLPRFHRFKFVKKIKEKLNPVIDYSVKDLTWLLGMSAFRNLIFASQYLIILWAMNLNFELFEGLLAVQSIFYLQTLIPSVALIELGIRAEVALVLFEPLKLAKLEVLTASFLLWAINLFGPALIGMLILFRSKLSKSFKNEGSI